MINTCAKCNEDAYFGQVSNALTREEKCTQIDRAFYALLSPRKVLPSDKVPSWSEDKLVRKVWKWSGKNWSPYCILKENNDSNKGENDLCPPTFWVVGVIDEYQCTKSEVYGL